MAVLLVSSRAPSVRPVHAAPINTHAPHLRDLVHLWPLAGPYGYLDLVTNQALIVNATSAFRWEPHPTLGRTLFLPSGAATASMLISGFADQPEPWTFRVKWHRITTSTSVAVLTSKPSSPIGVRSEQYPNTKALGYTVGGSDYSSGYSTPLDRGVQVTYSKAVGANLLIWVDGVQVGSIATGSVALTLSRLGNYADAVSLPTYGWWTDIEVWGRAATYADERQYLQDPWGLYAKSPRRAYVVISTGNTGTLAVTLGAVTLSATGTLAIAGTAAPTVGAVTSVATGTLALAGAASPTLGDVTLAGTSAVAIAGEVAATLGTITLAATGGVALAGQVSATLPAVTLSAAGTLLVQGVLDVTLDPITGALEGDLADSPGTGSLNGQLDPVTLTAAGVVALTGSASATFEAVTLTATGAVALAGQTAATLGAVTSTATGALAIAGVVTATLGEVTLAATGSSGVGAILDATLAPVTLAGTGAVALRGEVAATLAPVVLTAFGAQAQITMLAIVSEQLLVAHLRTEVLRRAGVATESLHG